MGYYSFNKEVGRGKTMVCNKNKIAEKIYYRWGIQYAERRNKKGRAMRGIVMKVRIELLGKGRKIETKLEGIMTREIEVNKDK